MSALAMVIDVFAVPLSEEGNQAPVRVLRSIYFPVAALASTAGTGSAGAPVRRCGDHARVGVSPLIMVLKGSAKNV